MCVVCLVDLFEIFHWNFQFVSIQFNSIQFNSIHLSFFNCNLSYHRTNDSCCVVYFVECESLFLCFTNNSWSFCSDCVCVCGCEWVNQLSDTIENAQLNWEIVVALMRLAFQMFEFILRNYIQFLKQERNSYKI
jgi:hypothetical protein